MGAGVSQVTLKNLEAASQHLLLLNDVSNGVCMHYEMRAGPAVTSCINEGQRRTKRFRQFLATWITGTGKFLLVKEMHFDVHHGI